MLILRAFSPQISSYSFTIRLFRTGLPGLASPVLHLKNTVAGGGKRRKPSGTPRPHGHVRRAEVWRTTTTQKLFSATPQPARVHAFFKSSMAASVCVCVCVSVCVCVCVRLCSVPSGCRAEPTFLRSTCFRGEDDEKRQDQDPGPCRSPAHHYRSAHSSLQSECILLPASAPPAAPLRPGPRVGH